MIWQQKIVFLPILLPFVNAIFLFTYDAEDMLKHCLTKAEALETRVLLDSYIHFRPVEFSPVN